LSSFATHWTNLASTRFSIKDLGSRRLILDFFEYVNPLTLGSLLVLILWLIKTSRRSHSKKSGQIGRLIIISLMFSLMALVAVLPQ